MKIYNLYQSSQYSIAYCKNSRWERELSQNAKFVSHTVTKTKNCHILRRRVDETQNFSGWKYITVSYFRDIKCRHIAFIILLNEKPKFVHHAVTKTQIYTTP